MKLERDDDTTVYSDQEIAQEVMHFYKNLVGKSSSSLKGLDIVALRKGMQISAEQSRELI